MSSATEPLPGTSDFWEPEVLEWRKLEATARDIFARYGYTELRVPVFERTEVFVRGLGNETDVVQKEMYTFQDRGGRSLTLRPEGTAGVMRAIANRGLATGEECRVFYMGPMFRGERPAQGRRRQFHQVGCEAVGCSSPWMDAEVIAMLVHFLDELGLKGARVRINSRGLPADRPAVAEALRAYFQPHLAEMCEDCRRRFDTNVWRMLDCKVAACHALAENAPRITDLLGDESKAFFASVCAGLDALGVPYELDPRLVRGLDYYVHTVFELTHSGLGAQNAIAGGGRYELQLPGLRNPIPGVGFAAGMERLLIVRDALGVTPPPAPVPKVYLASLGDAALAFNTSFAAKLRHAGISAAIDYDAKSMKSQMRAADRMKAEYVIVIGDSELEAQSAKLKHMADGREIEVKLSLDGVLAALAADAETK